MYPALQDGPRRILPAAPSTAVHMLNAACRRLSAMAEDADVDESVAFHRAISAIHGICDALAACEHAGIARDELRRLVAAARQIHARSPFIRRLQSWPRGYAGDFETIEWLCTADNRAEGRIGRALERYALTSSIAQQHRNKVAFQSACILDAISHSPGRILSMACGSSPDIRSVLPHVRENATFVLCDGDADALAFSAAKLAPIADRCTFVPGVVPRVLRRVGSPGSFDLIVAGGLFDYLSDRFAARTLAECWDRLLAPGGRMVFTNIATGNPFRVWLEYLADWSLIERSEPDIIRICRLAGISGPIAITAESTGLALLVSIRRPTSSGA